MSTVDGALDFELRRRPTQARALATFDLILDTAASLLDSHGFDALTTNLVAVEAGVSVRALYRYFPNKHAIVTELDRRMHERWEVLLNDAGDIADVTQPWREAWCSIIDAYVGAVRTTTGARALFIAMRGDPELRRVEDETTEMYIDELAGELRARRGDLAFDDSWSIATLLIRSTIAIVDEPEVTGGEGAGRVIAMLKDMHLALLAPYMD